MLTKKKAKICSISWGIGEESDYDRERSYALDEFIWNHKDFLAVVSAGNKGKQTSGNKYIDSKSLQSPATAKNCLTVGACENNRSGEFTDTYEVCRIQNSCYQEPFTLDCMVDSVDDIAAFSGRGPCLNGRRKPDVIAPGTFILSTRSSSLIDTNYYGWSNRGLDTQEHYMYEGGSSMATPLVAGCAALVREYLRTKHQPSIPEPSAALVKAALIHSACYNQYRYPHPLSKPPADNEQGWGRVDLQQVLNPAHPTQVIFIDVKETNSLLHGEKHEYKIKIINSSVFLRVTLVYTDAPGENLINNLNLVVYSPSGKYYLGNDFDKTGNPDKINNVEGVIVSSPELGEWKIDVFAEVCKGRQQDYAIVISGGAENNILNLAKSNTPLDREHC